jgi:hypothetical protein
MSSSERDEGELEAFVFVSDFEGASCRRKIRWQDAGDG